MRVKAQQENASQLLSSIKGESGSTMPDLSDVAKGGLMGLMSNPAAVMDAGKVMLERGEMVTELLENFNQRLIALEGDQNDFAE